MHKSTHINYHSKQNKHQPQTVSQVTADVQGISNSSLIQALQKNKASERVFSISFYGAIMSLEY